MNQHMGFTAEADVFLEEYAKKVGTHPCPHCGEMTDKTFEKLSYSSYTGMFQQEYPLHIYLLKDGSTVKEIVQAEPWSSGPCFFMCLERDNGKRIGKWSQEEINNA